MPPKQGVTSKIEGWDMSLRQKCGRCGARLRSIRIRAWGNGNFSYRRGTVEVFPKRVRRRAMADRGGQYPWKMQGGRRRCTRLRLHGEWNNGSTRRHGRLLLVRQ